MQTTEFASYLLRRFPAFPMISGYTLGICLDRLELISELYFVFLLLLSLGLWAYFVWKKNYPNWIFLFSAWIGLGGIYHFLEHRNIGPNDISKLADENPKLIQVRAIIAEEPQIHWRAKNPYYQRIEMESPTYIPLEVKSIFSNNLWLNISGKSILIYTASNHGLHQGDKVELTGWLTKLNAPKNPGEFNRQRWFADQGIHCEIRIRKKLETIARLESGGDFSITAWLNQLRSMGNQTIQNHLDEKTSGIGMALLFGEGSTLTNRDWNLYIRTGVVHVLAISGQHLVILGFFLEWGLRFFQIRPKTRILIITVILFLYAILTGGKPSAMRAAIVVLISSSGIFFRKLVTPFQSLSLAWFIILLWKPADLFQNGFQLSFLAVAILIWGMPIWFPKVEKSALEKVVDESRSLSERMIRWLIFSIWESYRLGFMITIILSPLVVYWQNIFSWSGLIIGPPIVLLTTIALISGLMLVLCHALVPFLAFFPGWITQSCLECCDLLVHTMDRFNTGCWYFPNISLTWVMIFYLLIVLFLAYPWVYDFYIRWKGSNKSKNRSSKSNNSLDRQEDRSSNYLRNNSIRKWQLGLIVSWLIFAGIQISLPNSPDELRVTFLAVGQGGCTVIETENGQVILYDSGSLNRPEIAETILAPFLWSRGIRVINEILISHADNDHYNAIPGLLDKFQVQQISFSSSFMSKSLSAVSETLEAVQRYGVPIRIVSAGDYLQAGNLSIEILHPPFSSPLDRNNVEAKNLETENERSLTMLLEHRGHRILLTGDLEKNGQRRLFSLPAQPVDILMAPHHGSLGALNPKWLSWSTPKWILSSQGAPRQLEHPAIDQNWQGIPFWSTWKHGAIEIRSHQSGLTLHSFATKEIQVIHRGPLQN